MSIYIYIYIYTTADVILPKWFDCSLRGDYGENIFWRIGSEKNICVRDSVTVDTERNEFFLDHFIKVLWLFLRHFPFPFPNLSLSKELFIRFFLTDTYILSIQMCRSSFHRFKCGVVYYLVQFFFRSFIVQEVCDFPYTGFMIPF